MSIPDRRVPAFAIRVNDADLPPAAASDVLGVTVEEDFDAPAMVTLQVVNFDLIKQVVTWSDSYLFAIGSAIEVWMGYQGSLQLLTAAEITGLEPEFSGTAMPTLTVRGHDRLHRLMRGRKTFSFLEMTDSEIADQVAASAGLVAAAQDTGVRMDYVLQHNQTDLEFLLERARHIGYQVSVKDRTLYYKPRGTGAEPALTLALGDDLVEFWPRLSTMGQVANVEVHAWDFTTKAPILSRASAEALDSSMGGTVSGPAVASSAFGAATTARVALPVFSRQEADQLAAAGYNDMALTYVTGQGTCIGRPDLHAGAVIMIEGCGVRFSGRYYVTGTTHSYRPREGYRTSFMVQRTATP